MGRKRKKTPWGQKVCGRKREKVLTKGYGEEM